MSNSPSPLQGRGPGRGASPERADQSQPPLPTPPPEGERAFGVAPDRPVTLAAIIGAHGITGEVRLKLFGEGPESLKAYKSFDAAGRTLTLKSIRPGPSGAVARFAEVNGRTQAEAMRGIALTVPRSALPPLGEGEYYHADLIGLPCVSSDGEALGPIVAIENFGAGDIIEIERSTGKRFMVAMHAVTLGDAQAVVDAAFVE